MTGSFFRRLKKGKKMERTDIKSLDLEEAHGLVESAGEKPFRAKQFTNGCIKSWPPILMK